MSATRELEVAFNEALTHVERSITAGLKTIDGDSARPQLERLRRDLRIQREGALERGAADREWLQQTVRWVTEWVPDTEVAIIATLGRIARAVPTGLS